MDFVKKIPARIVLLNQSHQGSVEISAVGRGFSVRVTDDDTGRLRVETWLGYESAQELIEFLTGHTNRMDDER